VVINVTNNYVLSTNRLAFIVLYYRYVQIICSLMSDDCRYLIETFEYDKNVPPHSGILLFFCLYTNI